MTSEEIIRMAREAGIPIETGWAGRPSTLVIKDGVTYLRGVDDLERFFNAAYKAGAAAEREAISDEYSSRLQGDLEHGVKWLNEAASEEFTKKYPELSAFLKWLDARSLR